MSQVIHRYRTIKLEELVWRKGIQILSVRGPESTEILRTVVFPKETHHTKSSESSYSDHVAVYSIREVVHASSASLKAGEVLKIFMKSAYSLADAEAFHCRGLMRSPVIMNNKSNFPVSGDEFVIFLSKGTIDSQAVWMEHGREGIEAKAAIQKLLDIPVNQRHLPIPDDWD